LLSGWQRIAHTSARQRLSRRIARRIAPAADCSYFRSSTAFTTHCAPYLTPDGSGLLILSLVNGFHDGFRAVLLSGWQRIAHSSTRPRLSRRFARRIAQQIAAHCSYFRSSTAFTMVCAPYCSAEGSALLIIPLVNGFHDGFYAVLPLGWQRIAHSSTRQWLSRQFARRISQRMAADCSFFLSSTAFTTVCAPYCPADGSGLLILALFDGFRDGLRALFVSGWRRIAHSFTRQRPSRRFSRRISLQMAADCSFFLSSTAFTTVCAPYCSTDCSALLILPLVNGFHNVLRAVLLSGWQRIAHTSARQRLSRRIARRLGPAADRSYFRSSTPFTTVCAPYFTADGSGLLILSLVNGFHNGLRPVSLSGWQRIAYSSARQRLSRRFSRRIARRMVADCSFFHSSTAFTTVCAPYCPADGSGLLILALFDGFHDGLRALFVSGWRRIAHSFSRQRLSRRFSRRIAPRMAADFSFLRSSTFTTVCVPSCSSDRSLDRLFFRSYAALPTVCMPYGSTEGNSAHLWVHSYLLLVDDFANLLRDVGCSPYCSFFRSSTSVIRGRFAYHIPQWMAAHCSFSHSSTAFTMVFAPYCSADG